MMAAFLSLAAGACALGGTALINAPDRIVRVHDVVSLGCIAEDQRQSIGDLVLAVLPPGVERVVVDRRALATLVRRRVPALRALRAEESGEIAFTAPARPLPARECAALTRPLPAGAPIDDDVLAPAPCAPGAQNDVLRFDRTDGVLRAARDLPIGENLGPLAAPAHAFPDTGDTVRLSVALGHTRIERNVEALQPAPNGGAIFVRDADGRVFAASIEQPDGGP